MTDRMNQNLPDAMNPAEFRDLMSTSFGPEPPQADMAADLAVGKRQLRRRRVGQGVVALATATVIGAAAVALPALGGGEGEALLPAEGGGSMTDQQVIDACLDTFLYGGEMVNGSDRLSREEQQRGLVTFMARPQLMTSARTPDGMVATLRSGDGDYWTECTLKYVSEATDHSYASVYPTSVTFPSEVVDGRRVYEPMQESDTRLEGTATASQPQVWVPCETTAPEETAQWREELAACDRFTVVWNDRRPAEVAKAKIVTPDGVASWADVDHGYLSFGYVAPMVPSVADGFRDDGFGSLNDGMEVTLYDKDGDVLVHDDRLGDPPADGEITIENYPSLSWWLR